MRSKSNYNGETLDEMRISETCSCGASTKIEDTDRDSAVRLVRDWRRRHRHEVTTETSDTVVLTSESARLETSIGFQADGLALPVRKTVEWEE